MSDQLTVAVSAIPAREDLAKLWCALDQSGKGSFFTAWPWIGTLIDLLPDSIVPQLVRLMRNGIEQGAAIAVRRSERRRGLIASRGLHFNATGDPELDCVMIEHNGFAGCEPSDKAAWRTLMDWFASGAADADELSIPGVTAELAGGDTELRCLQSAETSDGFAIDLTHLRAADGTIASVLSANARQQLHRSMRAIERMGPLELDAARNVDEAMAYFDGLKRLHIESWDRRKRRHSFARPFFERFHRALIARCIASGEVELLRLSAGGKELGFLYNLRRTRRVYAYQSGFDDSDRRLRPGYVAHALAIQRHCAAGDDVYDFMAGSNRLKESFATDRYAMRWYRMQQPLLRFRAENAARAAKSRLFQPFGTR